MITTLIPKILVIKGGEPEEANEYLRAKPILSWPPTVVQKRRALGKTPSRLDAGSYVTYTCKFLLFRASTHPTKPPPRSCRRRVRATCAFRLLPYTFHLRIRIKLFVE